MSISYSEWKNSEGTLTRIVLVIPDGHANTKEQLEKLRLECRSGITSTILVNLPQHLSLIHI